MTDVGGEGVVLRTSGPRWLLPLHVLLLWTLPAVMVIEPLGALGAPALLVAVLMFCWWWVERCALDPPGDVTPRRRMSLVEVSVLVWLWCSTLAYALAFTRALTPLEVSGANRSLVVVAAGAGVALTAASVRSRAELERLLRVVVLCAALAAAVGILQYTAAFDITHYLSVPGLTPNHPLDLVGERDGLRRVAGTASHAIEFGVVLAMVFPLAVYQVLTAPTRRHRRVAGTCLALIAAAVPMSVSRSAVLAFGVAFLVVMTSWDRRQRIRGMLLAASATVVAQAVLPGLLGTLKGLFLSARTDPSVMGRTEDYVVIAELYREHRLFGIGLGTFLPEQYFYLDNQVLFTVVTGGLIGLSALLLLVASGVLACVRVRRQSSVEDHADVLLSTALLAALGASFVNFFTFDALGFPLHAGLFFLLLGCAGALSQMRPREQGVTTGSGDSAMASTNEGRALPSPAAIPARHDGV